MKKHKKPRKVKKSRKSKKIVKNKIFPILMSLYLEHICPKAPKILVVKHDLPYWVRDRYER